MSDTSSPIYSALFPEKPKTPVKREKHQWGEKKATYRSLRMRCQKCGLERDAKSNNEGYHWVEYRMKNEAWSKKQKTPECQPYMTGRGLVLEAQANAKGWFWNGERWVNPQQDQRPASP